MVPYKSGKSSKKIWRNTMVILIFYSVVKIQKTLYLFNSDFTGNYTHDIFFYAFRGQFRILFIFAPQEMTVSGRLINSSLVRERTLRLSRYFDDSLERVNRSLGCCS